MSNIHRKVSRRARAFFRRLREICFFTHGHHGRLRPDLPTRKGTHSIPIGGRARLDVFWKDLPIGKGPAVSYFIDGEEILRIDCFGRGDGHLHDGAFLFSRGEQRLFLPEPNRAAQVERAIFEITRNAAYYQARIPFRRIRAVKIDQRAIEQAAREAGERMREFLETIPTLEEKEDTLSP